MSHVALPICDADAANATLANAAMAPAGLSLIWQLHMTAKQMNLLGFKWHKIKLQLRGLIAVDVQVIWHACWYVLCGYLVRATAPPRPESACRGSVALISWQDHWSHQSTWNTGNSKPGAAYTGINQAKLGKLHLSPLPDLCDDKFDGQLSSWWFIQWNVIWWIIW